MDVNGCHIDCTLNEDNPEGFSSLVSRDRSTVGPDGKPIVETILRGPFKTILEAQKYAHAWKDGSEPPEIIVTETASESVAVKTDPPVENPPVVEPSEQSQTM